MDNINFLILDTETTGLDSEDNVIIEIGYGLYNTDLGLISQVSELCWTDMKIPPEASAVHHITNDMLKNASTLEHIIDRLEKYCVRHNVQAMVCHNLAFDSSFLRKDVNSFKHPHLSNLEGICTLKLARKLFPELSSHSLQVIRYALNLNSVELKEVVPHRASADVLILSLLFNYILKTKQFDSLEEFIKYADEPFLVYSLPFGKHKGIPINKVERGYLEWLLKRPQLDDDIRYTVEVELGLKTHLTTPT